MAENNNFINVGGRLHSIATGNVLAGTDEIYDDSKGKKQSTINAETDAILAQHTSVIQGLNSQNYKTYAATNQTTAVTDVLPTTGSVNTVYRLGNWDGSQFNPSCYTEYSWDGTQYVSISTKTQIDEVFDISAYYASGGILATYADLSAALDSNNGGGVPQSLQRGGMSIKFVCSSDNKYVQYRLMSNTFSTTESDWQGVDNEPTAGSDNLIKSGGVAEQISQLEQEINKLKNAGYFYAGIAIPTTNPGTPNSKVFYIANGKDTYTNFGNLEVTEDEVVIFYYDTVWHKVSTGIASHKTLTSFKEGLEEKITELGVEVAEHSSNLNDILGQDDTREISFTKASEAKTISFDIFRGGKYILESTNNNMPWSDQRVIINGTEVARFDGNSLSVSFIATENATEVTLPATGKTSSVDFKLRAVGIQGRLPKVEDICAEVINEGFSIVRSAEQEASSYRYDIEEGCSYIISADTLVSNDGTSFGFRVNADDENFQSFLIPAGKNKVEVVATSNGQYFRIGVTLRDANITIKKKDIMLRVEDLEQISSRLTLPNKIEIRPDNSLRTSFVDTERVKVDFGSAEHWDVTKTIAFQIYSLFDSLVEQNSSIVSKIDLLTYLQQLGKTMTYPSYLQDRNIYVYKFSSGGENKKTALFVSGLHGAEIAAPFNTYMFFKQMCDGADSNYFKMLSVWDFVVIPCLNMYGMCTRDTLSLTGRCNGRGVDINRNFDVNWDAGSAWPAGDYARSEFETDAVSYIMEVGGFDFYADLHNYGSEQSYEFYSELYKTKKDISNLLVDSYYDVCSTLIKDMPEFFGSKYLLLNKSYSAIGEGLGLATSANYARKCGIPISITIEINEAIAYKNGLMIEQSERATYQYSKEAFYVAEYTLRNQLCKYLEYAYNY